VKFVEVMTARNAEQFSKDTETAINNATKGSAAIDALMVQPIWAEVGKTLLKSIRIADAKQDKGAFIAVKVLVKIVATMQALGQNRVAELDPYTRTIGANLCKLNGVTNKSALVCLSSSIEYDALDQQQALSKRYNCSANTAGTQASSTRMMMRALGICDVSKGKRGDVATLQDNDRARAFVKLYDERTVSEETEQA
jgi:hypothetical protein